jgi:putative sterol carrier protein
VNSLLESIQSNQEKNMPSPTISEFMSQMSKAFVAEKAAGIDATIQLKLTGVQAVDYYLTIKNGQLGVSEGVAPDAKLTLTADSEDFMKLFSGQIDPMKAFMQGKLKVTGDMSIAMKMMGMFKG